MTEMINANIYYVHVDKCLLISILPARFLKAEPGYLISKYTNPVIFLSVYKLIHSSNKRLWRNYRLSYRFNVIDVIIQKMQRHDDLIKAHAVR